MPPTELRRGLWRWSAPHPDWHENAVAGSSADWPREVGCALYETSDAAVFIDPLAPAGEAPTFWRWADLRCAEKAVHVLTTLGFHRRSRDAFVERYGAITTRARRSLPTGVESLPLRGAGETIFWLSEPRVLVPGDRIIGSDDGRLSLCPQSWLDYLPSRITVSGLRALMAPLLELPIEAVLVSHGEPVLTGGKEALARALA
jgi:hypothetical protein